MRPPRPERTSLSLGDLTGPPCPGGISGLGGAPSFLMVDMLMMCFDVVRTSDETRCAADEADVMIRRLIDRHDIGTKSLQHKYE
mmetsp:Transcript_16556/g.35854  ORF Transcript_16556/g.35854 Transcript_16556/m.35854 type:complete len:84 (+) Transcript_16556:2409-2660(+)